MNKTLSFKVNGEEFSDYRLARDFAQLRAELTQCSQTIEVSGGGTVLWHDDVHPVVQFHAIAF